MKIKMLIINLRKKILNKKKEMIQKMEIKKEKRKKKKGIVKIEVKKIRRRKRMIKKKKLI
jgi:hypothetical protein